MLVAVAMTLATAGCEEAAPANVPVPSISRNATAEEPRTGPPVLAHRPKVAAGPPQDRT